MTATDTLIERPDDVIRECLDLGLQVWRINPKVARKFREAADALAALTRERDELRGLLDNERVYAAEYRGGAQLANARAEAAEAALAQLWEHLHSEPRMDGSYRVMRTRITPELAGVVRAALTGEAT